MCEMNRVCHPFTSITYCFAGPSSPAYLQRFPGWFVRQTVFLVRHLREPTSSHISLLHETVRRIFYLLLARPTWRTYMKNKFKACPVPFFARWCEAFFFWPHPPPVRERLALVFALFEVCKRCFRPCSPDRREFLTRTVQNIRKLAEFWVESVICCCSWCLDLGHSLSQAGVSDQECMRNMWNGIWWNQSVAVTNVYLYI